ncbi:hypothetical protein SLS53_002364 [Cytospora paraplurivora]|uniref:Major facilitator superfamily (MFS) profile domain-containing protein n=1 Tax=Cytospora paraplurivora TaxID=2898453 RepID=A0AAN9YL47_9PEZI
MGVPDIEPVQVATKGVNNDVQDIDIDGELGPANSQPRSIDPKEERAFVWRLDLIFLTMGFLGYMFKYIDQTNISNAYVSGMQEDLHLYGNELNYFTTFFNIGYMVMLWPSCIIISHIGPEKWLPTAEILWGVFTCCLSTAKSARTVYGLRFLIGFCEATTWPAYNTLISQWYLPSEVGLRMALYEIAQPAGAMLSGATQGALATNLHGVAGRAGWRWAFIINPERPNPLARFYLGPRQIEIALERARRIGRKAQIGITLKGFLRCFTFWQLWAFAFAWPLAGNTTPSSYFNLWLKSLKNSDGSNTYSVSMLNYIPIIGQAISLVATVIISGASDLCHKRLPFLLLHSAINITSLVILVIRPANRHAHFAGYFLNYIGDVAMVVLLAWATEHLQDEPQVRTLLFASGTIIAYAMAAFIPIAAFPSSQAPHWRIGSKLYLGFSCLATVMFFGIWIGFKWEAKKKGDNVINADKAGEPDSPVGERRSSDGAKTTPAVGVLEDKSTE